MMFACLPSSLARGTGIPLPQAGPKGGKGVSVDSREHYTCDLLKHKFRSLLKLPLQPIGTAGNLSQGHSQPPGAKPKTKSRTERRPRAKKATHPKHRTISQ